MRAGCSTGRSCCLPKGRIDPTPSATRRRPAQTTPDQSSARSRTCGGAQVVVHVHLPPRSFPGRDGFDDPVGGALNYDDSHGQQQQSPQFYADLLLFDPPASSQPASGAPSNTPRPSEPSGPSGPPASAPPPSATSGPSSASAVRLVVRWLIADSNQRPTPSVCASDGSRGQRRSRPRSGGQCESQRVEQGRCWVRRRFGSADSGVVGDGECQPAARRPRPRQQRGCYPDQPGLRSGWPGAACRSKPDQPVGHVVRYWGDSDSGLGVRQRSRRHHSLQKWNNDTVVRQGSADCVDPRRRTNGTSVQRFGHRLRRPFRRG